MNRDEILQIAWDVGLFMRSHPSQDEPTKLERFAERIAALEREACAKVCDGWSKRDDDVGGFIGRAIRARGET